MHIINAFIIMKSHILNVRRRATHGPSPGPSPGPWALPWALVGPCGDRALRAPPLGPGGTLRGSRPAGPSPGPWWGPAGIGPCGALGPSGI